MIKRKMWIGAGVVSSWAAFAGLVWAHTYEGTSDGTGADNRDHWGCWVPNPGGAIPNHLWDHLFSYMAGIQTQINFTIWWDNPCNLATDMWLDDRLNDGVNIGLRTCLWYNGAGECDRNGVYLNPTMVNQRIAISGLTFYQQARKTWCHEVGHSLGLGHDDATTPNDCMVTGDASLSSYSPSHNQPHLLNDYIDL